MSDFKSVNPFKQAFDIYTIADALQNARDHIMQARFATNRNREIDLAIENVRDAMKLLGIKEAENNVD